MPTELIPILLVVAIYGAASALLTAAARKTLSKCAPGVERALQRVELAKRLLPCVFAFALLCGTDTSFIVMLGVTIPEGADIWHMRWTLALLSGIFSGYAWHWTRDMFKGKKTTTKPADDVPPDADAP